MVEDAVASNGAWPTPVVPVTSAQVELPKEGAAPQGGG